MNSPLFSVSLFPFRATLYLLVILCCAGCAGDETGKRTVPPDELKKLGKPVKIKRFEQELYACKKDTNKAISQMSHAYPDFFPLYIKNIIGLGDTGKPATAIVLQDFLHDAYMNELYLNAQQTYPDLIKEETLFSEAFARYRSFFPSKKPPHVIAYISGYRYANVTTTHTLGIGLEMYLGEQHEAYKKLGFPVYKIKTMDRPYMVTDALSAWISTEFENDADKKNMLSQMIFMGKVLYSVQQLLPDAPDSLLLTYSNEQVNWCRNNKKNIWAFFTEKKLFFQPLSAANLKYLNDAPFTAGMPRESPGKIAVWLGFEIVKSYMRLHAETGITDLFNDHNAEIFLQKSRYKP